GNSSKGMGIAASLNPATIPMASLSVPAAAKDGARVITAQDSNGVSFTNGTTMTLFVLKNGNETVGFGCDASEYNGKDVAGRAAMVERAAPTGCAPVTKATIGQKEGAPAVIMVNNAGGLPPFEGPILSDPNSHEKFTVTIPFFGVAGPPETASSDAAHLLLHDGQTVTINTAPPVKTGTASFTSSS